MSAINLEYLFNPKSVAVIGATNDPANVGNLVMRNIMTGGFLGPVMPVTAEVEAVAGVLTYPDIAVLPKVPDLAIVCRPIREVPAVLAQLGELGTRAAMLLGSSFAGLDERTGQATRKAILDVAQARAMRILGPRCLGFMAPNLNLNASLAHTNIGPGRTAFISQSDSLFTTVLDWAKAQGLGFSHMVALGRRLDVTVADVLDYLGSDPNTRSILLYVESVCDAREFMSAARAASRNKPVLVLRPGLALEGVPVDYLDSGIEGLCMSDEIYDVAFRRAGMLRVATIDGLFDAARTLADAKPVRGNRLAIVSNGVSAGLMAADALLAGGGQLARLAEETLAAVGEVLGGNWTHSNPVDLPYNAGGEHYAGVIRALVKDRGIDAVLVMHVPFAGLPELDVAQGVGHALRRVKRMVLTSWLGTGAARKAREFFAEAGIPSYDTPDKAIRAFLYMVEFQKNRDMLMETPASLPSDFFPDTKSARRTIRRALDAGRDLLTESEARDVLADYGIPAVETRVAVSAREAVIAADELGYPVALKLRSPQIPRPFDVGGVLLDLDGPEQLWEGAAGILARVGRERPDAYIEGFTVQRMGRRPGAHELFIAAEVDPVFGPIIHFGHGGMVREVVQDRAVTMPPLSMSLAREVVGRTRISTLLGGTPTQPAADMDDVCLTLIQVSQLLIDLPQVVGLDINPLYADDLGVLALGAQIRVAESNQSGPSRLAIRPYPRELEECAALKDGTKVIIRPVRPEDEHAHRDFLASLTDDDLRLRFFGVVRREFDHHDLARFTQIDYDREMAFIAQSADPHGQSITLGVSRTVTQPDNSSAEFAIAVSSSLKGMGLGSILFQKSIEYTRARGTKVLVGQTMVENLAMQALARKFGFTIAKSREDPELVDITLEMN